MEPVSSKSEAPLKHFSRTLLFACAAVIGTSALSAAGFIVTSAQPVTSVEGTQFSGMVGTFTDTNPNQPASNFTASINWGDGTTSAATIAGGNGSFNISGNHIYADEGSFNTTVVVQDQDGEAGTGIASSNVGDAPLSLISHTPSFSFAAGVPLANLILGKFGDANPFGTAGDFEATIDWGDGSTSAATISGNGNAFDITGGHIYANSGTFGVSVSTADVGGSTLSFKSEAVGGAVPEPGSLAMIVIGLGSVALMARRKRANPRS
jgi:hypothetical protein